MNLSNASKIRFNGVDIKLAKINGVVVYKKEEEDPLLIARYTANASGVLPVFDTAFKGYETEEVNNGVYTVTIRTNNVDNLPSQMGFQNNSSLLTVEYLNTRKLSTMNNMFRACSNLVSINTSNWITSSVTDMYGTFYGCGKLTSLDLRNWDTSKVTTMASMFANCVSLTSLDLSKFNTNNLTNIGTMFYGCTKLASVDLRNWDTSKVTTMNGLFQNCNSLSSLDLSSFNTSNITHTSFMFASCYALTTLDLSSFSTSKIIGMDGMFYICTNLTSLNLSSFDISNVTSMTSIFESCNMLTSLDSMTNISTDLVLPISLDQESVLDVVDNLAPVTTTKTLKITSTQLSWMSEDKIKEANDKGWTISV